MFDLPPPPPLIVTEHRAHTCECHHCGAQTRAAFPEDVTSPAQYGDGIAALAAYLQTLHCIPEKRLAQLILDTYDIKILAATLARLIAKKAKEMNPPFHREVRHQHVVGELFILASCCVAP